MSHFDSDRLAPFGKLMVTEHPKEKCSSSHNQTLLECQLGRFSEHIATSLGLGAGDTGHPNAGTMRCTASPLKRAFPV